MQSRASFAEVIVDVPTLQTDKVYHYAVPDHLARRALPGVRVVVPFGGRRVQGYIVGLCTRAAVEEVKEIAEVLDEAPILGSDLVELAGWIASRFLCLRVEGLRCVVPGEARYGRVKEVRLLVSAAEAEELAAALAGESELCASVLRHLARRGEAATAELSRALGVQDLQRELRFLSRKGWLELTERVEPRVRARKVRVVSPARPEEELRTALVELRRRAPKQAAILETLLSRGGRPTVVAEVTALRGRAAALEALRRKGLVAVSLAESRRDPYAGRTFPPSGPLSLTQHQRSVLKLIDELLASAQKRPLLLHGVTGSGKTEVYLQAMEKVLDSGRQAIVLVPEILLTPQTVERFAGRFPGRVAVLHSRLSAGERFDEWRRAREGRADVVVGARSAVFAPFEDIGLIVLDEEHETSYKQEESPRYHAREAAIERARLHGGMVILGSATPSVESYYRAARGDYLLGELPERVDGRELPPVTLVDMREELRSGNRGIFSRALADAMARRLARREQVILFLNRRGFATFVLCRECGFVVRCPRCDVSLVLHTGEARLRCHYCGYDRRVPQVCPNCRGRKIRHFGVGTQQVQEEVRKLFAGARVMRLDLDAVRVKGAHDRLFLSFRDGEADVLVGTQMVAKGFDLPLVTLVGVISADTSLHLPDFRAAERTFQLLTQVAGRAGRGERPGEVVVQTYAPDHYSIQAARTHDYRAFYAKEIAARSELGYPPFTELVSLVVSHRDAVTARDVASRMAAAASSAAKERGIEVLGPAPAPFARLRGRYRWQLALKGTDPGLVGDVVRLARDRTREFALSAGADTTVDVNPLSLL